MPYVILKKAQSLLSQTALEDKVLHVTKLKSLAASQDKRPLNIKYTHTCVNTHKDKIKHTNGYLSQ